MARLYSISAGLNNSDRSTPVAGADSFPYGTFAALIYQTATSAIDGRTIFTVGSAAQDFMEFFIGAGADTGRIGFWNGAASSKSTATINAAEWWLVAATKDTGTATPRGHYYRFTTATWTHENMSASLANMSSTAATEISTGYASGDVNGWDGHLAAWAIWKNRIQADGEVERLARGRWAEFSPDFHVEYPTGRDFPARVTTDQSRNRARQTTAGNTSVVAKGTRADPPGFRFSALNWRR